MRVTPLHLKGATMAESKAQRGVPSCGECSKSLSAEDSIALGIGPVCRGKLRAAAQGISGEAKRCGACGCLIGADYIPALVQRAAQWIMNMAEGCEETLPEQAKMMLTLNRISKLAQAVEREQEHDLSKCPEGIHIQAPDSLSDFVWVLVSWMKHRVEPWLYFRHRNYGLEVTKMYQHLQNILEFIGQEGEAACVIELKQGNRTKNVDFRKRMYRYRHWYPVEE